MARVFLPTDLDPGDLQQVRPFYEQLLNREPRNAAELEQWLADLSELCAALDEFASRRYIDKSCRTDDPGIERAYLDFVENVEPAIKPLFAQLQAKFLRHPARSELAGERYDMLVRKWTADIELFRDANVPVETRITRLVNDYDKISAAMTVVFQGTEYTLQQLGRFIEEPDRSIRQEAWTQTAARRLRDHDAIETIFETLLPLRQEIASNAGLANYRDYIWKSYKRFDYTPSDCLEFADAIADTFVPLVRELDVQRAHELKLDVLRPWDLSVDLKNRPPLRPFAADQIDDFILKTGQIFKRLSPALTRQYVDWVNQGNLDLASRKGKQPGGYQCALEESAEPFIFMNAAGVQRDVETLLHECGHAFHCVAASDEPLVFLRSAPMEFCEVASMSMELFGSDHFDLFYTPDNALRAKRAMLEGIVRFFPWMATIDAFQHWIYTHPGHSRTQRTDHWLSLLDRFASPIDWSGLEPFRAAMWHRQLHLFHAPFYYVEYGIAQLGALQLWVKAAEDPTRALGNYRSALRLGGTRSLPRLFDAAGIRFDFSRRTIEPLIDALRHELAALPV